MASSRVAGLLLLSFLAAGVVCTLAQTAAQPKAETKAAAAAQAASVTELEVSESLQNTTESSVGVAAALWKKAVKQGKCIVGKSLVDCGGDHDKYLPSKGYKRPANKYTSGGSTDDEPSASDYSGDEVESPGSYEAHEMKSPVGPQNNRKHRKNGKHGKSHNTKHGGQSDTSKKHADSKEVLHGGKDSSTEEDTYAAPTPAPSPKTKKSSNSKGTTKAPTPAPRTFKELQDVLYGSPSTSDDNGYEDSQQEEEYEAPAPSPPPKKHSSIKYKDTKHKGGESHHGHKDSSKDSSYGNADNSHKGSSKNMHDKQKHKQHKGSSTHDVGGGDQQHDGDSWYSLLPPGEPPMPAPTPPPTSSNYKAKPPTPQPGYAPKPKSTSSKDKSGEDEDGDMGSDDEDADNDYYDDIGKYLASQGASNAANDAGKILLKM